MGLLFGLFLFGCWCVVDGFFVTWGMWGYVWGFAVWVWGMLGWLYGLHSQSLLLYPFLVLCKPCVLSGHTESLAHAKTGFFPVQPCVFCFLPLQPLQKRALKAPRFIGTAKV